MTEFSRKLVQFTVRWACSTAHRSNDQLV